MHLLYHIQRQPFYGRIARLDSSMRTYETKLVQTRELGNNDIIIA